MNRGSRRRNDFRQQRLKSLPDPQGQRSLRGLVYFPAKRPSLGMLDFTAGKWT
jgi:hypothetical protein